MGLLWNRRVKIDNFVVITFFGKDNAGNRKSSGISVEDNSCKLVYTLCEILSERTKLKGYLVFDSQPNSNICKIIDERGITDRNVVKEFWPDDEIIWMEKDGTIRK